MHVLREKDLPQIDQLLGQRRARFNEWRVEALEDVRIRLEGESNELLDFPVNFFIVRFQLLRNTGKRPFEVGGRQIKTAAVHVRSFLAKPIGSGPNDTAIDHKPVQICDVRAAWDFILYVFEDGKVDSAEALLWAAICKPDAIAVLRSARGMSDDADASPGSRQDFGAFGNDNVNLFFHFCLVSEHTGLRLRRDKLAGLRVGIVLACLANPSRKSIDGDELFDGPMSAERAGAVLVHK